MVAAGLPVAGRIKAQEATGTSEAGQTPAENEAATAIGCPQHGATTNNSVLSGALLWVG